MTKELGLMATFPKSCLDNTYDKNYHPSNICIKISLKTKPEILLPAYKNCKITSAVLFVCRNGMFCKWTTLLKQV